MPVLLQELLENGDLVNGPMKSEMDIYFMSEEQCCTKPYEKLLDMDLTVDSRPLFCQTPDSYPMRSEALSPGSSTGCMSPWSCQHSAPLVPQLSPVASPLHCSGAEVSSHQYAQLEGPPTSYNNTQAVAMTVPYNALETEADYVCSSVSAHTGIVPPRDTTAVFVQSPALPVKQERCSTPPAMPLNLSMCQSPSLTPGRINSHPVGLHSSGLQNPDSRGGAHAAA